MRRSFALLSIVLPTFHTTLVNAQSLGSVHFPVSCSAAAQQQFDRALSMLHSFWYPQGLNAFQEVLGVDPSCAIAHWGVAVSVRANPLVGPPDRAALQRGAEAIARARALDIGSARERDYVDAIGTYFTGWETVDYRTRVLAYEAAMRHLHERYPDDREAALFYALALNEAATVAPADPSHARHLQAATIIEQVLRTQPDHPGALHYLIHSYDYPSLATRGLTAAQRYASVAPSAPHALHMPSHVFSMLGMWQESIASNRAALTAAPTYAHAMDFMMYAYLQGAQDSAAAALLVTAAALRSTQAAPVTATPTGAVLSVFTALAAIPARHIIERGAWQDARALQDHPGSAAASAITVFTRALAAARTRNVAAAQRELQLLRTLEDSLSRLNDTYWAQQVEIQRTAAGAWAAQAQGNSAEARRLMQRAADLEDATEKHVAMENRLVPMRELLGELLLEQGAARDALAAFEASLRTAPERFRSFHGAANAARRLNDPATARGYYERLLALTRNAQAERAEVREARAYLNP